MKTDETEPTGGDRDLLHQVNGALRNLRLAASELDRRNVSVVDWGVQLENVTMAARRLRWRLQNRPMAADDRRLCERSLAWLEEDIEVLKSRVEQP